jgi:8-amino-7-oxononanoate synthase
MTYVKKDDTDKKPRQRGGSQSPWNSEYAARTETSSTPVLDKAFNYTATEQSRAAGIYAYYRALESVQGPLVTYQGRELVMMGSNNYLGLVDDPRVIEAAREAALRFGTGCAGSRLLNGSLTIHEELEERLADFVGKPGAMVYATGFQANLGTLSGLLNRGDTVVVDKYDHASIVDGVLLSRAKCLRFRHNDTEHLAALLDRVEAGSGILVVVDGVFSMEGDIAPLPEIIELCKRYGAALMVDDAHGLGVLGEKGRGTAFHFNCVDDVDIVMGTFSKSLASVGGFIAADRRVIDFLKHNARAMIFSASMPPASVGSVLRALDILDTEPERIEMLWKNTRYMQQSLTSLGFDIGGSCTPIMPVMVGDDMTSYKMCQELIEEGIFVNPVPGLSLEPGHALIRVSVMATHERKHLDLALEKFEKVGRKFGLLGGNA